MKRGDVVTVAIKGEYGKPRPAVVVQSGLFNDAHPSVTPLPLTSTIVDAPLFRLTLDPGRYKGVSRVWQVMVDNAVTLPLEKVGIALRVGGAAVMTRVPRGLHHGSTSR